MPEKRRVYVQQVEAVLSVTTAIVLAAVVVATLLVPIVGARPPLAGWGDLLVVVGLMALGRFVLALSAQPGDLGRQRARYRAQRLSPFSRRGR